MHPISRTLRAYAADAREAFRIAPVEVLLGVSVALAASIHLRANQVVTEDGWARLLVFAWVSFTPLLGLTALRLRGAIGRPARIAAAAGVLLAAALYALLVFEPGHTTELWRIACLMLAGIGFLLLTPAVPPRAGDRLAHWWFAFGVLARTLGVAAYAGVLFGALCGAVASVVNLFELKQPAHLYQDLAAWIFLAAAPWILVGGIGRLLEDAVQPREGAPLAVVRFGRFVYAPILVVYLAILYAYGVKVLLTQELPKNLVSPLVLSAGMLGMAGALLLEPVHRDGDQRGLSLLVRWVPALLLPLLPFAFVAILMRQGQYGWTEFRYLRLVGSVMLAIVAILGTVWLARRRMPPLASVPGILALGLLLASVGPWSAQAVSRRDQTARLRATFREAGVRLPLQLPAPDAEPRDSLSVTPAQFEALRDGVRYLAEAHGPGTLVPLLGPNATRYSSPWGLAGALPLRTVCPPARTRSFQAEIAARTPIPVSAGTLVELGSVTTTRGEGAVGPGRPADDAGPVGLALNGMVLEVSRGAWRGRANLAPLVSRLGAQRAQECETSGYRWGVRIPPAEAQVPLRGPGDAPGGELIVTRLNAATDSTGWFVQSVDGYLLLP